MDIASAGGPAMTSYEARGVSPDKAGVLNAVGASAGGLFPGAFCQAVPDVFNESGDHCFLLHADGAGTKASLAYVWWRETGDDSVFGGLAEDALVMNIDDLLCAGATGPFVYSNIINRNAKLVPDEVIGAIVRGYVDLSARLERFGIHIQACGGETADVGDLVRTLTVDAVVATQMLRKDFINLNHVRPGLAIVGMAGDGQALWERQSNSGIGSNGFTSARHEILDSSYRSRFPETYDANLGDLAYVGRFKLTDPLPGSSMTIGQALLSPTRTYAPILVEILADLRPWIHGIVHNTGGGITKCLRYGEGIRYVKDALLSMPPIFELLRDAAGLSSNELARVYNLGQRLEVLCDISVADQICEISKTMGVDAGIIGRTESARDGNELVADIDGERLIFPSGGRS